MIKKTSQIHKTIVSKNFTARILLDVEQEIARVYLSDKDEEIVNILIDSSGADEIADIFSTIYHEIKSLEGIKKNEKGN